MAFKRSAVRTRLSPPRQSDNHGQAAFFFFAQGCALHYNAIPKKRGVGSSAFFITLKKAEEHRMNYYSHKTNEGYREETETLPYKLRRSRTSANVSPTNPHSSLLIPNCERSELQSRRALTKCGNRGIVKSIEFN